MLVSLASNHRPSSQCGLKPEWQMWTSPNMTLEQDVKPQLLICVSKFGISSQDIPHCVALIPTIFNAWGLSQYDPGCGIGCKTLSLSWQNAIECNTKAHLYIRYYGKIHENTHFYIY